MRHFKHQILFIIIILYSCGQSNQSNTIKSTTIDKGHTDTLFINFDTLENKWNSIPVNFDTLYLLAKHLNLQADNYPNRKEIKLTDIYKRCADIYRIQEYPNCDPNKSPLLCSKDSTLIIDCYIKSLEIYHANSDTLSTGYTDGLFQLADVYEQLGKYKFALPLREDYLNATVKRDGFNTETTGDAYMLLGSNYEHLKDYKTAYDYYLKELENRRLANDRNYDNIKTRVNQFKIKHQL